CYSGSGLRTFSCMNQSHFSINSTTSVSSLRLQFKAPNCEFMRSLPLSPWRRSSSSRPKTISIKSKKLSCWPTLRNSAALIRVELGATENRPMLGLVISLLIIALIAAALGFGGIAGAAAGIAKIIFFIFIVLFLLSLLFGGLRGGFRRGP